MKKTYAFFFFTILAILPIAAEKAGTIGIDIGVGFGMGVLTDSTVDENNMPDIAPEAYNSSVDNAPLLLTLSTIRIDVLMGVRYYVDDRISVGVESGRNFLPSDYDDEEQFTDIPIHLIGRYGNKKTYLQAFAGYYLNIESKAGNMGDFPPNELHGGPEIGIKGALGGLYIAGSYIFNSYYIYPRFSIGYARGFEFLSFFFTPPKNSVF